MSNRSPSPESFHEEKTTRSPYPSVSSRFANVPTDVLGLVTSYAPHSLTRNYRGVRMEMAVRPIIEYGELLNALLRDTDISNVTCSFEANVWDEEGTHFYQDGEKRFTANLLSTIHKNVLKFLTTSTHFVSVQMSIFFPSDHEVFARLGDDWERGWAVLSTFDINKSGEDRFGFEIGVAFEPQDANYVFVESEKTNYVTY